MGQTPFIEAFKCTCGYSNVDSTTVCVERVGFERVGVERRGRWSMWWCALWIACSLSLAAGCVETAECSDTVSCPDEQVCYAYTCRDVCETQQECGGDETCTPCSDDGADSDEGECFGEELSACVPEQ